MTHEQAAVPDDTNTMRPSDKPADRPADRYDIVVCGGGIAGLTLAKQLHDDLPGHSILLLDRLQGPLPEASLKVGESTIEAGAYYYAQTIGLADYLETQHLEKLGLRYFFPGGDDFARRPEIGVADFLPAKSYQLDRGKLENHLREWAAQSGIDFCENAHVREIQLCEGDDADHEVQYRLDGDERTVRARWVVDAMGRRRLLQRRLKLDRELEGEFNSVWFRVAGRLNVDEFVPETETEWHQRVNQPRWFSTNHLMGRGYWVWVIPLSSENTSVGIVTADAIHPFQEYNSFERACAWLQRHEPLLANALTNREILDFKRCKNYSYTSVQVFSRQRWACVGEAGVFADPYYSVGSNMIAFSNGFTKRLIELDFAGELTQEYVDHANHLFLSLNDTLSRNIHRSYSFHHKAHIMALKTIWDYHIGWTTTDPQLYHDIYLDPQQSRIMSAFIARVVVTQERMMRLFEQWALRSPDDQPTFGFIDYVEDLPTLKDLFIKNLPPKVEHFRTFMQTLRESVNRIEELAQVIFLMAVEDLMPEHLARFGSEPWVNIEAISMEPESWEKDGLFRPKSRPRDLTSMREELARLFAGSPGMGSAVQPWSEP